MINWILFERCTRNSQCMFATNMSMWCVPRLRNCWRKRVRHPCSLFMFASAYQFDAIHTEKSKQKSQPISRNWPLGLIGKYSNSIVAQQSSLLDVDRIDRRNGGNTKAAQSPIVFYSHFSLCRRVSANGCVCALSTNMNLYRNVDVREREFIIIHNSSIEFRTWCKACSTLCGPCLHHHHRCGLE